MGKLKPIGSEKLTGDSKIKRMIEIARFNESIPSTINETSKSEYGILLSDGNRYEIVKEKLGYIVKMSISESETEYIEPMKNRKYHSSYSQALKRLNLLAGELNRINENTQGISLFGEDKKFVLKTPKPEPAPMSEPPSSPQPVPSPELPPSPAGDEMGGEDMPMDDTMGAEGGEDMPMDDTMGAEGGEDIPMDDVELDADNQGGKEGVTFKLVQKLTGKLTQKIRELENKDGMTSEDIKYVINMVLSSLELNNLSDEDKEDIMTKFEEDEMDMEDMGGEDMGGEEMGGEEMGGEEMGGEEMGGEDQELGEVMRGAIIDSIFAESKVDKVLSKYFELTKKEILETKNFKKQRLSEVRSIVNRKMKPVIRMSETIEQELASKKFLEENFSFVFVGKTNKKNLVFENKNKQIKISPEGLII
jgi:hypothetical protein